MRCRAQELCESRGGRPGLPVPYSPYGLLDVNGGIELEPPKQRRQIKRRCVYTSFKIVSGLICGSIADYRLREPTRGLGLVAGLH